MSIQNWLTFASIITSLVIALISVHQTKVAQELASRPYISFYLDNVDTVYFSKYLVLKNTGNSPAKITSISFETENKNSELLLLQKAFKELTNDILTPDQKLTYSLTDEFSQTLEGKIEYEDLNGKKYNSTFVIKTDLSKMLWTKKHDNCKSNEANTIENATAAIIKNLK